MVESGQGGQRTKTYPVAYEDEVALLFTRPL